MLCFICHSILSKNHYILPCGHRFHFKCIYILDYYQPTKCPYCRQTYEESISFRLRSRTILLNKFKKLIKKVNENKDKSEKTKIIIDIFTIMKNNFRIIRYLKNDFFHIILIKINQLKQEVILEPTIPLQLKNSVFRVMDLTKENIEKIIN
jgi:hypothetical protein